MKIDKAHIVHVQNTTPSLPTNSKQSSVVTLDISMGQKPKGDQVQVSAEAKQQALISRVTDEALHAPSVDMDRVVAIRQAIADGSYQPDIGKIAEALLTEGAFFTD